ncbi:hypothetical protein LKD70_16370 [Ruminococcus sp. CLA-AA-H200]|uniref:Uncharacterized protein n=1 Tax=Ruminococcus turbiniformis TaxID=2881258 RepID=A0ABS8G135_9FIRM|nr:hypothetical protein [Ruminococcus turbiniformis]MCC2255968.1 hypothetical protein [Ruminococcus turbiniformis]
MARGFIFEMATDIKQVGLSVFIFPFNFRRAGRPQKSTSYHIYYNSYADTGKVKILGQETHNIFKELFLEVA